MSSNTLQSQILFQLYRTWSSANPMFVRLGEGRFNITRREWRILATLANYGACSSTVLAQKAELDPARTSRTVTRLVTKGWISREKHAHNTRSVWITLTPAGQALYDQMMPIIMDMNNRLTQDLSPEEKQNLLQALEKITQRAMEMNEAQIIPEKARRGIYA